MLIIDSLLMSKFFSLWERCGEPSLFFVIAQAQAVTAWTAGRNAHSLEPL